MGTDSVKRLTVSAQVFRSFPVPSCKCDTAWERMAAITFSYGGGGGGGNLAARKEGNWP